MDGKCGRSTHLHSAVGESQCRTPWRSAQFRLVLCLCNCTPCDLYQQVCSVCQGGETADYIGAVRAFGIADKVLFEQLTKLDNQEMIM